MKKLILLLVFAMAALAQPSASCFQAVGSTYPCSSLPQVQVASVGGTAQINVDSGPASSTVTTLAQAFPGVTTKGNTILCLLFESAAAAPTVADSQSNTYVTLTSSATSGGVTAAVAVNIVGGTTDTITETLTAGTAAFACYELVGTPSIGQVWDLNQIQQGTGSTVQFTGVTATVPGEMIFGAVGFTTGQTVNATPTLGAPVNGLVTVDASNTAIGGTGTNLKVFYAAHTTLTQATPFTPSFALSGSSTYTGIIVSVKPPSPIPPIFRPETSLSAGNSATGTGSTAIFAAAGAGLRNYVTSCQITNTSASNSYVNLEDGSTVMSIVPAPSNTATGGGGGALPTFFNPPIRGSVNTAFNFVAGAGVTTLYVYCQGYTGQ